MARILIAYSTVDGHTLRICDRIRRTLADEGHAVTLCEVEQALREGCAAFDKVVVGASIRYGRHRPAVHAFVERHRPQLESMPSAFFTVNVVARKPGKDTPDGNPYLKSFLRSTRWTPAATGVFAGKIDYAKYNWADRTMIRFIMWLTNGPTDPAASVEFTDWRAVDAFSQRIGRM
jgi:menaquinone-dependent protoporphyrinogen oxidase